jgi:hypothetical protein
MSFHLKNDNKQKMLQNTSVCIPQKYLFLIKNYVLS